MDENQSRLLSACYRNIICKTWDQAKRDADVAPQVLFRFIKAHPDYQKKFIKFANVPQAELMTNGNFLAQAYTTLAGLNVVIQSLSSQELMASQLNALGGAHQPRGVVPFIDSRNSVSSWNKCSKRSWEARSAPRPDQPGRTESTHWSWASPGLSKTLNIWPILKLS